MLFTGDGFLSGPFRTGSLLGSFLVSMKFIVGLGLPTSQRASIAARCSSSTGRHAIAGVAIWVVRTTAGSFRMNSSRDGSSAGSALEARDPKLASRGREQTGGGGKRRFLTFSDGAGKKGCSGGAVPLQVGYTDCASSDAAPFFSSAFFRPPDLLVLITDAR